MPRRQKLKVQWIEKNGPRNASFRKRRDTLIQKTRELSILCSVPAAVVVYGGGEAERKFWPEDPEEVKQVMRRYRDLPDSSKEAHRLDNVGFMRRRTEKMRRKVESYKATSVGLEVNLVINDVALGRPREFDEMPRELAGAVVSTLDALRSVIADRINFLLSGGADAQAAAAAAAALPPPPPLPIDEAAAPVVAYPPPQSGVVADALFLLPAPELEPEPEQSELMVAPAPPLLLPAPEPAPLLLPELVLEPEDPHHPPIVIPPEIAEALLLLLAPEPEVAPPPPPAQEPVIVEDAPPEVPVPEPQATAAAGVGVGEEEPVDLNFEPRNGSFLLEVADAIIDDGSGRLATEEDVDRLLREYGLEHMKPPK
ncbi:hypothetical protein HU200_009213 [Digitaria exilis]|uniref:MADS-box domain-containing protein n=1 Tax=Digitaria exilis TaxID=1010633 RepID=A0A835FKE8_9POAL|nr:hypothetical protein HU200_009213 [Digitaria exilis]CAB3460140.1 unnamed protein product [Digitaria exilis]